MIKKLFHFIAKLLIVFFALAGVYYVYSQWQYHSVKTEIEKREAGRTFDKDLKYNMPLGEPIFMVNPANTTTFFFIDGFRGQIGAGHYREWFEVLFNKYHINIVSPITGLQGWPFAYRTRDWHREEDMRQALQIYDAYCAHLPAGHRIVVGSMSFGGLSNITIAAKGKRKPDAIVMVAPLNTGLDYKSGNALTRWLSTQVSWLRYIKPYIVRGKNSARATLYDIVNNEKNLHSWEAVTKYSVNWEENLSQGIHVNETAVYMERDLVPQVKNEKILILYGDSDLTFSAKGFETLAGKLRAAGNTVGAVQFPASGHMLLYDNGGDQAKKLILDVLQNNYMFK